MSTITQVQDYKIEFNGSSTYFISIGNDCVMTCPTERKARNFFNRMLKDANIQA